MIRLAMRRNMFFNPMVVNKRVVKQIQDFIRYMYHMPPATEGIPETDSSLRT